VLTLRVQTGCEERCTYCIIPATRGPVRSAPPSRVVNDVALAAGAGYREIVLTGVHLGSYGRDLAPRATLADLLRALDAVRDDVWFRVSSLEPMDCTRDVLDILSSSVRFAPHLHLPLQHGSDPMLAAMGRPYTRAQYARLVDEVRQRLPHAAIGSDVIVGFPGETDADFRESCDYLINSPLTSLHVFPYSDRPGTAASRCEPKVAGPTVRARGVALRELARDLHRRFQLEQIGTVRPALTLEDGTTALTDNYLKVRIPGGRPRNQLVGVLMTGLAGGALEGVPADIASAMR
jgi:threonylcarbamoyladenosine tRNA methylthiotransferase MtaB